MIKEDTSKQHKTANKLNIFFTKKGVQINNLPKVLRSKNVLSKMPSDLSKDDIPLLTFKLQQPIRFKLSNNKMFVESFDINSFIQDEAILTCRHENSLFIDPERGYMLTGDLQIAQNNNLGNQ